MTSWPRSPLLLCSRVSNCSPRLIGVYRNRKECQCISDWVSPSELQWRTYAMTTPWALLASRSAKHQHVAIPQFKPGKGTSIRAHKDRTCVITVDNVRCQWQSREISPARE